MSNFKALNVESDDDSDDEVDNTKEIQIEESLKLYQIALKYHSEGPSSYAKAEAAYKTLFKSEIFQYAESQAELGRVEAHITELEHEAYLLDDFVAGAGPAVGATDSAPDTLPQILHLSHKNYGQFILDRLQHELQKSLEDIDNEDSEDEAESSQVALAAGDALKRFTEALDKDDTDLDLWRRASIVSLWHGSSRISRYCLESVLDGDGEAVDAVLSLPGIEQSFASQNLKLMVQHLRDDLSEAQILDTAAPRKQLPLALLKRLGLGVLFSPSRTFDVDTKLSAWSKNRLELTPEFRDWGSVGSEIIKQIFLYNSGRSTEASVGIKLSAKSRQASIINDNLPVRPTKRSLVAEAGDDSCRKNDSESNTKDETVKPTAETPAEADASAVTETKEERKSEQPADPPQPSRKRSTESAGLPETAEGGRSRSKRLRARETLDGNVAEPTALDLAKQYESLMEPYIEADRELAETFASVYASLNIETERRIDYGRSVIKADKSTTGHREQVNAVDVAIQDLYNLVSHHHTETQKVLASDQDLDLLANNSRASFLKTASTQVPKELPAARAIAVFEDQDNLSEWVSRVNQTTPSINELAISWLEYLLVGKNLSAVDAEATVPSSYLQHEWDTDLKESVLKVILLLDDVLFDRLLGFLQSQDSTEGFAVTHDVDALSEMIQTVFELHLDINSIMDADSSKQAEEGRHLQRLRLEKWSLLAREAINSRPTLPRNADVDQVEFRHVWASILQIRADNETSPEHKAFALHSLRAFCKSLETSSISLPNSSAMPGLSYSALEKEMMRLRVTEFFNRTFDCSGTEPATVIENLEPLLEHCAAASSAATVATKSDNGESTTDDKEDKDVIMRNESGIDLPLQISEDMVQFLGSADIDDVLSLWQRLRQAYDAIDYPPKSFSIFLRCLELIVQEICSTRYAELDTSQRHLRLVSFISTADALISRAIELAAAETEAMDFMDEAHLQSSISALNDLSTLLQVVNVYEDSIQIGQSTAPAGTSRASASRATFVAKIRAIQIRAWTLQFALLKEGMRQKAQTLSDVDESKVAVLRCLHEVVGLRSYCALQGKALLKLLKDELMQLYEDGKYEQDIAQVFFDIYGLKFTPALAECADHGCSPDLLDKRTAIKVLDFIISQTKKINVKDFHKTELRHTIDKVQIAIAKIKTNDIFVFNHRILQAFMASPIDPVELYRCLKGVGQLSTKPISAANAVAASKGWYLIIGEIALNRFISQKKVNQGPAEDLHSAVLFLGQEIEYYSENWIAWFRLAQAHCCQVEESVSWSAEKMNSDGQELAQQQRSAIHSFQMAVACLVRSSESEKEDSKLTAELYSEFGMRMFCSLRPPFSRQVFRARESDARFYSRDRLYKSFNHVDFDVYSSWKFTATLFQKAIQANSVNWMHHYMLGKCLLKMHQSVKEAKEVARAPSAQDIVQAFIRSINCLPEKKDSRREPILEPHYKLTTTVYKLVQNSAISAEEGDTILQASKYARKVSWAKETESFEDHILQILKSLDNVDKSGWHHRMSAKSAQMTYNRISEDKTESENSAIAEEARKELTQHIFTKAMAIQVWRPEHERPGRHFVYTSRYLRLFVGILKILGDRATFDLLSKRVRKKPLDFFEHTSIWSELCEAFVDVLRRHGEIPKNYDDSVFRLINYEEFTKRSLALEAWAKSEPEKQAAFESLRDAVELKKTNNALLKGSLIDDLICDAYAKLYATIAPTLKIEASEARGTPQPGATVTLSDPSPKGSGAGTVDQPLNLDGPSDHATPTSTTAAQAGADKDNKPRIKSVSRRETLRKAEACVASSQNQTPTVTSSSAARNSIAEAVDASSPLAEEDGDNEEPAKEGDEDPDASMVAGEEPVASANESADESELSDLEDEIVVRPMFPGLFSGDVASDSVPASSSVASPEPAHEKSGSENGPAAQAGTEEDADADGGEEEEKETETDG